MELDRKTATIAVLITLVIYLAGGVVHFSQTQATTTITATETTTKTVTERTYDCTEYATGKTLLTQTYYALYLLAYYHDTRAATAVQNRIRDLVGGDFSLEFNTILVYLDKALKGFMEGDMAGVTTYYYTAESYVDYLRITGRCEA